MSAAEPAGAASGVGLGTSTVTRGTSGRQAIHPIAASAIMVPTTANSAMNRGVGCLRIIQGTPVRNPPSLAVAT